jgi:hypothetical protein
MALWSSDRHPRGHILRRRERFLERLGTSRAPSGVVLLPNLVEGILRVPGALALWDGDLPASRPRIQLRQGKIPGGYDYEAKTTVRRADVGGDLCLGAGGPRLGRQLGGADQGGRLLTTTLTGAEEVPGPGDPDGTGFAAVTVNPGKGSSATS